MIQMNFNRAVLAVDQTWPMLNTIERVAAIGPNPCTSRLVSGVDFSHFSAHLLHLLCGWEKPYQWVRFSHDLPSGIESASLK
jgi:hypothetical protein